MELASKLPLALRSSLNATADSNPPLSEAALEILARLSRKEVRAARLRMEMRTNHARKIFTVNSPPVSEKARKGRPV